MVYSCKDNTPSNSLDSSHKRRTKQKDIFFREELNVGTVPTFKMHNVGTVPTFKMHNVGTVPTFKMHNVGTPSF